MADAAALAGAGMLILDDTNEDAARAKAIEYAAMNTVNGEPVVLQASDVEVFIDEHMVRVTVRNTSARDNALPTYFGRILGIDRVDVVTDATAEAAEAGAAIPACLLPIALIDFYTDLNANGQYDEGEYGEVRPSIPASRPPGHWNVYVRLTNDSGLPGGEQANQGPVTRYLRLIE